MDDFRRLTLFLFVRICEEEGIHPPDPRENFEIMDEAREDAQAAVEKVRAAGGQGTDDAIAGILMERIHWKAKQDAQVH